MSTNIGGSASGFWLFWLMTCYSQDWLFDFSVKSFCEKVWLPWVPYVKFWLFWLSRLKFCLIRNDTFMEFPIFGQNFLGLPPSGPLIMLWCDLWLFCKQERIINETSKNPRQRLKTKLAYFNDFRWRTIDQHFVCKSMYLGAGSFVAHWKYPQA